MSSRDEVREATSAAEAADYSDQSVKKIYETIVVGNNLLRNILSGIGMCEFKMALEKGVSRKEAFMAGLSTIGEKVTEMSK
jgi:hypothetical protein